MGGAANRVSMIAAGKRGITGDTAQRLAAAFGIEQDRNTPGEGFRCEGRRSG
jgi:plasmid maintenance system antidote protein VapI